MSATREDPKLVGSDRVLAVLAELAKHPTGLGLEDMARAIQLGNPAPDADALRQIAWLALGLVIFVVVMWRVNDHRALARYGVASVVTSS